jgi:peptidoglycan/LPS O-acetylase OafA/YrhL
VTELQDSSTQPARDGFIDGWRAVAALLVVVLHGALYHWAWRTGSISQAFHDSDVFSLLTSVLLRLLAFAGSSGVPIFFMISGFIITTLLCKEQQRNGSVSLLAFYVRRTFRIFPAMFIYVGAVALLARLGILDVAPVSVAAASTFTCNIIQCDWWYAHYWSLAFEEQFYIFWPLAFVLVQVRRKNVALVITAVLIAVSAFIPYLSALAFLGIGVSFALLNFERTISLPRWLAPSALAGACFIALIPQNGFIGEALAFSNVILLPAIFIGSMYNLTFRKILDRPWLSAIGRASYGLYLWQQVFLAPMEFYHVWPSDLLILGLPLCVWGIYTFVEVPLMRLGRRISDGIIAGQMGGTAGLQLK